MNIIEKFNIWLHGQSCINLFEDFESFRKNEKLLQNMTNHIISEVFNFKKPCEGQTYLPDRYKYLSVTAYNLGDFSDYFSLKLQIKDVNENILFHFYKLQEQSAFVDSYELSSIFEEFSSLMNNLKEENNTVEQILNTGIYTKPNSKLVSYLYAKNKMRTIADMKSSFFDDISLLVPEYLLFKQDKSAFMIAEVRNPSLKQQVINNNFTPIIEKFKIK